MEALVLYESYFGDTREVAEAVAEGIAAMTDDGDVVTVVEVSQAPLRVPESVDLLVVGAPTHAFSLPRPGSRARAAEMGGKEAASDQVGVREWLAAAQVPEGQSAAVFDTRLDSPRSVTFLNHTAHAAQRGLTRMGAHIVAPAGKFIVEDTRGPLADGELERARRWGATLVAALG